MKKSFQEDLDSKARDVTITASQYTEEQKRKAVKWFRSTGLPPTPAADCEAVLKHRDDSVSMKIRKEQDDDLKRLGIVSETTSGPISTTTIEKVMSGHFAHSVAISEKTRASRVVEGSHDTDQLLVAALSGQLTLEEPSALQKGKEAKEDTKELQEIIEKSSASRGQAGVGIEAREALHSQFSAMSRIALLRNRFDRRMNLASQSSGGRREISASQSDDQLQFLNLLEIPGVLPSIGEGSVVPAPARQQRNHADPFEPSQDDGEALNSQMEIFGEAVNSALDIQDMNPKKQYERFNFQVHDYKRFPFPSSSAANAGGTETVALLPAGYDMVPETRTVVPPAEHFSQPVVTLDTFPLASRATSNTAPTFAEQLLDHDNVLSSGLASRWAHLHRGSHVSGSAVTSSSRCVVSAGGHTSHRLLLSPGASTLPFSSSAQPIISFGRLARSRSRITRRTLGEVSSRPQRLRMASGMDFSDESDNDAEVPILPVSYVLPAQSTSQRTLPPQPASKGAKTKGVQEFEVVAASPPPSEMMAQNTFPISIQLREALPEMSDTFSWLPQPAGNNFSSHPPTDSPSEYAVLSRAVQGFSNELFSSFTI